MIKINGTLIEVTMFPDRTSQVWKLPKELFDALEYDVEWEFEHEGEIMHLAQIRDLFRGANMRLHMTFMPYARQDKRVSNETTFAMLTFANVINSLNFLSVSALDVHNEKECQYQFSNFYNVEPTKYIDLTKKAVKPDIICFPDAGARERYKLTVRHPHIIIAQKVRNQLTGVIESITISGDVKNKSILIIDDICDGGKTFTEVAKVLYGANAREVNLYVTHGIFSKGLRPLEDAGINRIFTKTGEANETRYGITYTPWEKL